MKIIASIILSLVTFGAVASDCASMLPYGKPIVTATEKVTYLCRQMYVLEHSPSRKTAYWSAEHLIGSQQGTGAERVNAFKADPDLPKIEAGRPADYEGSGYDQGHMSPVGDMHSNAAAMLESFYLSNMVPQTPGNNRDGWNHLEYFVRGIAMKNSDVYVITGPVYQCTQCKTIGRGKVWIPTHLYKIVVDVKTKQAISFLVPNIAFNDSDIPRYISDIATIQKAVGINFFPKLPTTLTEAKVMWSN